MKPSGVRLSIMVVAGLLLTGLVLAGLAISPALRWCLEWQFSRALPLAVTISEARLAGWPVCVQMRGVGLRLREGSGSSVGSFTEVTACPDWGATGVAGVVGGRWVIQSLQVRDADVPLASRMQAATGARETFVLPSLDLPAAQQVVSAAREDFVQPVQTLAQRLDEQTARWQNDIQSLPGAARLQALEARLASVRRMPAHSDERRYILDTLRNDLDADRRQLQQADQRWREDWQYTSSALAELRGLPATVLVRTLEQQGVSEASVSRLGTALMEPTVQEWLDACFLFARLQAQALHSRESLGWLVRRTQLAGRLRLGVWEASMQGEVLNLGNHPSLAAGPQTLRLVAQGDASGRLQVSAVMDSGVKGAGSFNFSLTDARLHDFALLHAGTDRIVLDRAVLALDIAGTLSAVPALELNLGAVLSGLELSAAGPAVNTPAGKVLMASLHGVNAITVTAAAKGAPVSPQVSLGSDLDAVLLSAMRPLLDERLSAWRASVLPPLEAVLQEQLQAIDAGMVRNNRMLAQPGERIVRYDALLRRLPAR